jgi:predicted CxxxxCH...CXXCH cytochrome family protein
MIVKNMKRTFILVEVLAVCAALVMLSSCSKLRDDLPVASTGELSVHPTGWAAKTSPNFHGGAIMNQGWDMSSCQTCHGPKYDGGVSGVSCKTCHGAPGGPEACNTCHGGLNNAPPSDLSGNTATTARGVGAHQTHMLGTTRAQNVACSECHTVPGSVYAAGHVDSATPAEVVFNGFLSSKATAGATPVYNAQTGSCANNYCHGNFKNGNAANAVSWNSFTTATAACGTCHGNASLTDPEDRARPKTISQGGTHPDKDQYQCFACHIDVVDATLKIISPSKHINGKLNVFGTERDM